MANKKRIALITTWFPPHYSVATNRMLAFAEYLSESFEVHVFALDTTVSSKEWTSDCWVHYHASSQWMERLKDKQEDGPLKHKFKVVTRILLSKVVKNPMVKWQKATLHSLVEQHKQHPFDGIISSFSPQETHLVAIDFCRQFKNIPWIADMRDEMSTNPYIDASTRQNLQRIEADVNELATAILSVSYPIVDDFKRICPKVPFFEEIRNGFNHSIPPAIAPTENSVFTMGYFGTFYGARKPNYWFEALRQMMLEDPNFDCQVEIIGAHQNYTVPTELNGKVHLRPALNYTEAIHRMLEMDVNVMLHPKSKIKGVFTGKLFDYISVKRPVLAFVDTDDVAAELVNDFQCGYVASFDDVAENKRVILAAYEDWKSKKMVAANDEQVASLHRKNQVAKLTELIQRVLKQ